jgi:hypothetical protein
VARLAEPITESGNRLTLNSIDKRRPAELQVLAEAS